MSEGKVLSSFRPRLYMNVRSLSIATIYESMASSSKESLSVSLSLFLIQEHSLFPGRQVALPLQRLLKGDKIPLESALLEGELSYN